MAEGNDILRRHAEWNEQVNALDAKEFQLHQSQMKLLREQNTMFFRDLKALRQDVEQLAADGMGRHENHAKDLEKIENLFSQLAADAVERYENHTKDLDKIEESTLAKMRDLERSVPAVVAEHFSTHQEHASAFEQMCGDRADKQWSELHVMKVNQGKLVTQLDQYCSEVHAVKSGLAEVRSVPLTPKALYDKVANDVDILIGANAVQATLHTRVDQIEQSLRDCIGRCRNDLDPLLAAHAKYTSDLSEQTLAVDTIASAQSTIQERVTLLETMCGDAADKQAKKINTIDATLSGHAGLVARYTKELDCLKERVTLLDTMCGDAANKAKKINTIDATLSGHAQFVAKFTKELDCLKDASTNQASVVHSIKDSFAHQASTLERITKLESRVSFAAEQHSDELRILKGGHEQAVKELRILKGGHAQAVKDLDVAMASVKSNAAVGDRLQHLERLLTSSFDNQMTEIQGLKDVHCDNKKELENIKRACLHHAVVSERLHDLEQILTSLAEQHAKELRELKEAHAQQLVATCKQSKDLAQIQTAHAAFTVTEERLRYLEHLLGDSFKKNSREMQGVARQLLGKGAHA